MPGVQKSSWSTPQRKAIMAALAEGGKLGQKIARAVQNAPKVSPKGGFGVKVPEKKFTSAKDLINNIQGGTASDRKIVSSALSGIPDSHFQLAEVRGIQIHSGPNAAQEMLRVSYPSTSSAALAKAKGEVYGVYDERTGIIHYTSDLAKKDLINGKEGAARLVRHELGHAVSTGISERVGADKWNQHLDWLAENGGEQLKKRLFGGFSKQRGSSKEPFADAYSVFMHGSKKQQDVMKKTSPAIWQFFEGILTKKKKLTSDETLNSLEPDSVFADCYAIYLDPEKRKEVNSISPKIGKYFEGLFSWLDKQKGGFKNENS